MVTQSPLKNECKHTTMRKYILIRERIICKSERSYEKLKPKTKAKRKSECDNICDETIYHIEEIKTKEEEKANLKLLEDETDDHLKLYSKVGVFNEDELKNIYSAIETELLLNKIESIEDDSNNKGDKK